MSEVRKTKTRVGGKDGIIVHDKLTADGPVDPKTGEPLIDPKTGEPYPGKNDDMADLIHDYLVLLRSYADVKGHAVPRFGALSLVAANTPIFVYDHPRFMQITNTAFTDGMHVFVCADFMRKLREQEEDADGRQTGITFLLLHELMHKIYCHVDRLKAFPHVIANTAEDMVINGKLIKSFKMDPVPLLNEIGFGMKPEEADKYHKMAEEVVAEMLLIQERKKKKDKKNGNKQKNGQDDNGQSGSQGSGDEGEQGNDGKSEKNQKSQGGNGQGDGQDDGDDMEQNGEYSPIHHISPEDLIRIIEEEGLSDTVGKVLDLPKSDDVEAIGKKKSAAKMNDVDAIQNAISQANKLPPGTMPGEEIATSAAEVIGGLERGKLSWKMAMRKHIIGDGLKLRPSDDEAAIPWYLSREVMGVDPWYSGALVPQSPDETVLVLMDTSGSTSGEGMREAFASEIIYLKKGVSSASETAREVILISADTSLKGAPQIITANNVDQILKKGVPVFGNGGTDFARCLLEALKMPVMKKKKISSVIYFTDCCDNPPRRADFEEYINKGIKIIFITTPGMWNEQWNRDVSSFAEVYCIEKGVEVDLDSKQINKNTRKNKM